VSSSCDIVSQLLNSSQTPKTVHIARRCSSPSIRENAKKGGATFAIMSRHLPMASVIGKGVAPFG